MKVIFRLKSANLSDRQNYVSMAHNIIRSWDGMKDLDAMVIPEDVEVYVVDSDSEIEVRDDKSELFSPETTFDDIVKMVAGEKENE